MTDKFDAPSVLVSRRSLLGGILGAAVTPILIQKTWARSNISEVRLQQMQDEAVVPSYSPCTPIARYQHTTAGLADGRVLIAGGWRHANSAASVPPLADAQIYDPRSHSWEKTGTLNMARAQHAAVTLGDGRVLVIGGMNHAMLASTEIYDPATQVWTLAAPMEQSRCGHAATYVGGLVVVSGGFNQGPQASLQIYDVAADTWRMAR